MIRRPAVAGAFYERDPGALRRRIEWCFKHELGPGTLPVMGSARMIKGVIAPHAGYMYSGPVAAHAYHELVSDGIPETLVILCPNHTGMGSGVSLMHRGAWETPLGTVEIDSELAGAIVGESGIIDPDETAHLAEHSCEVHVPFVQYFTGDFRIVPVTMWMQDHETAADVGHAVASAIRETGRDAAIIASTDFTHYSPQDLAEATDRRIIERITAMDDTGMYGVITELNATMCGYGPVAATIIVSRILGATECNLLSYATSGDVTGDRSSVVGYASLVLR
jgi:AmmeMemoRadiSam system protein B